MAQSFNKLNQRMFDLSKRVEPNANQIVKDAAKAFLTSVVEKTPVDTGQAVSSWKVGLNYQPSGPRLFSPGSKGSTAGANRSAALGEGLPTIEKRKTGQNINIVNTVEYISRLNAGSSRQAPAGFIESAFQMATIAARRGRILGNGK